MGVKLQRVGTTYIPVKNVETSSKWYIENLGAELTYRDQDKSIINLANQSFFLVKAKEKETANFIDDKGEECFSITFEVDGLHSLEALYKDFKDKQLKVGVIENRGHSGRNFVFWDLDGNQFDVWSELSPSFKAKYNI
ncbi:VOC family protein [Litchfieldia alkalitelluris]|uniref:VOC family protein n=1 Tax=Litchfieldia alkalitelluris TaxID=304268 RepID=UPI000997414C|nr:VOC family protein [Litchfieldia alkalitelluris]